MSNIVLRNAEPKDFQSIIALNEAEVIWTSPMDLTKVTALHGVSRYHKVAEYNGDVVGFLLAMDNSSSYINENFSWFAERYTAFMYIDRIVIDTTYKGLGIGKALYQDLFNHAKTHHIPVVCCEYNLTPVNEPSKVFHAKLGFKQVGERTYSDSEKVVSMQAAET